MFPPFCNSANFILNPIRSRLRSVANKLWPIKFYLFFANTFWRMIKKIHFSYYHSSDEVQNSKTHFAIWKLSQNFFTELLISSFNFASKNFLSENTERYNLFLLEILYLFYKYNLCPQ